MGSVITSSKPEGLEPPEVHYDVSEAKRYSESSRINEIQRELAERCVELLELDPSETRTPLMLDIGCGSGISGEVIDENGFPWIGVDVSSAMLELAQERDDGHCSDLVRCDIGQHQGIREGVFDGAISVSVIQWLCHAFNKNQDPRMRLRKFFAWLYKSLARDARAVLQFYPMHQDQVDLIGKSAASAGFNTAFVVDNPDSTKKRKVFLVLTIGTPMIVDREAYKPYNSRTQKKQRQSVKEWIINKKEKQRAQGKEVRNDSKYTARKRRSGF